MSGVAAAASLGSLREYSLPAVQVRRHPGRGWTRCHDDAPNAVASDDGLMHQALPQRAATRTGSIPARSSRQSIRQGQNTALYQFRHGRNAQGADGPARSLQHPRGHDLPARHTGPGIRSSPRPSAGWLARRAASAGSASRGPAMRDMWPVRGPRGGSGARPARPAPAECLPCLGFLGWSGRPGSNRHDQLGRSVARVLPVTHESMCPGCGRASARDLPPLTLSRRTVWHAFAPYPGMRGSNLTRLDQ
jgi:hypothetical protein